MVDAAKAHWLTIAVGLVVLWLVGAPVAFLVSLSFRTGSIANPGAFALDNYRTIFTATPHTYPALLNTAIYAVGATAVSLCLAILFAWLTERTDMPGKNLAWVAILLPIAMPGMLSSMAWTLLLAPHNGILNVILRALLAPFGMEYDSGPINIFGLGGMIFVEGIRGTSTLFLMLVGTFRLMDPSLEEVASSSGASRLQVLRRVTLPLMVPALLAAAIYAFLGNLDDFDTPLLLGLPAGVFVLPTLIYFTAYTSPAPNFGLAAAYSSLFIVVMVLLSLLYYRKVIRRSGRFATVTGKGFKPKRLSLGGWRYVALASFGVYFMLAVGLPFLIFLWSSLLPVFRTPSLDLLPSLSLTNYVTMATDPRMIRAVWNTLVLAFVTPTATMVLAILISWLVVRLRVRGSLGLDLLSFMPHAVPTVAIGVALIVFYLHPAVRWIPIYGTVLMMALAMLTRYLAFGTRLAHAGVAQLGWENEEAAWVSGASRFKAVTRVTLPILLPTFLAGWLWVAAHAFRNLTIPLLLATENTETVTIRLFSYWERDANFPLASAVGVTMVLFLGLLAFASRKVILRGFSSD